MAIRKGLLVFGLCLVLGALLSVACRPTPPPTNTPVPPTSTPTSTPTNTPTSTPTPTYTPTFTPTPTPTPTNTPTPTPTPTPTATPATSMGMPVVGSSGWLEIQGVRQVSEIQGIGNSYTPNPGFAFLVVDVTFHNLDPIQKTALANRALAVVAPDGEIKVGQALSFGANATIYFVGDYTISSENAEITNGIVFVIDEDDIDEVLKLQFRDLPPILFSADQEISYPFETQIGDQPGLPPTACEFAGLLPLGDGGHLAYQRPEEAGRVLGAVAPDGTETAEVCDTVTYGELQIAADGAALLLVYPTQGWPSLFLVEPDGTTVPLVENADMIGGRFDPSGSRVFFVARKLGETVAELYVYDREAGSTTLVETGDAVGFRFLSDGRLLVDQRFTEEDETRIQISVGAADGSDLETLDLPDDAVTADSIAFSGDGRRVTYIVRDEENDRHLMLADLEEGGTEELEQSGRSDLQGVLSPDGSLILIGVHVEDEGYKATLLNLDTEESWTLATGSNRLRFAFSDDGQWASVLSIVRGEEDEDPDEYRLYVVHTADGSVQEIDDAINAFFSPDSTQIAYTLFEADESLEMYVTALEDGEPQSLGSGILSGWFPLGATH